MRDAVLHAHAALRALRIPHALCGGLAVAVHGYLRATRDVDLLTGDDVFEQRGPIVFHRHGVPAFVADVPIACVTRVPGVDLGAVLRVDELVVVRSRSSST